MLFAAAEAIKKFHNRFNFTNRKNEIDKLESTQSKIEAWEKLNYEYELKVTNWLDRKLIGTEFIDKATIEIEYLTKNNSTNSFDSKKRILQRKDIIDKAHHLKNDGMSVENMFLEIKNWLLTELEFTNDELLHRFGFELHEHEEAHQTFNKFVNKNRFADN